MAKKSYYKPKMSKESISAKAENIRTYGHEPDFSGVFPTSSQKTAAFNWYHATTERATGFKWLKEYIDVHLSNYSKIAEEFSDHAFPTTLYWLARMLNRAAELPSRDVEWIHKMVEREANKVRNGRQTQSQDAFELVSIKESKISLIIADIEDLLDNEEEIDVYQMLTDNSVRQQDARQIAIKYQRELDEIVGALNKTDAQLVEAYECYGKKLLQELHDTYKTLIEDSIKYAENKTRQKVSKAQATRATNDKRKIRSGAKENSKFKHFACQERDDSLKLVSVSTSQIIGATEAWFYNTTYKILTRFVAQEGGFDIHRTGLTNLNEEACKSKRIGRVLSGTLDNVLNMKKNQLAKMFDTIDSEATAPSNRINTNMILLRVIK